MYIMNRITPIGFTGQDAKAAATQTGKAVTRFSLATTKRYQQDAEWKEKTYWHDCVVYGSHAPFAAKLKRGTHVVIEGELTYREYNRTIETESGAINVLWPVSEIVVDSITILNRKRRENTPSEDAA
jgi:single-strand DNA-binding protein